MCHILRKQRGERFIDLGIVLVEPGQGFRTQEFGNKGGSVYMTTGQGLETQPLAEVGRTGLAAEDNVLMSYSMHAFAVYARFI